MFMSFCNINLQKLIAQQMNWQHKQPQWQVTLHPPFWLEWWTTRRQLKPQLLKSRLQLLVGTYIFFRTVKKSLKIPKRPIVFNNCQVTNNKKRIFLKTTNKRYYLFSRNQNLAKFFVSRLVFFANTPPKHDISLQYFIGLWKLNYNFLAVKRFIKSFNKKKKQTKKNRYEITILSHVFLLLQLRTKLIIIDIVLQKSLKIPKAVIRILPNYQLYVCVNDAR